MRDVENMFYVSIVNRVKKNMDSMSADEVCEQVDLLLKLCPEWIFEVKNDSGKILRFNKIITFNAIAE